MPWPKSAAMTTSYSGAISAIAPSTSFWTSAVNGSSFMNINFEQLAHIGRVDKPPLERRWRAGARKTAQSHIRPKALADQALMAVDFAETSDDIDMLAE